MEEGCSRSRGYGVMLASLAEPGGSGKRDRALRQRGAIVGIYLPTGVNPWGHRIYDPIMAAADATGLPVCLHSVTLVSPAFPASSTSSRTTSAGRSSRICHDGEPNQSIHSGAGPLPQSVGRVHWRSGIAWVPHDVADGQVLQR